ncbi:MAG: terminase large subunit domain-containing protein [bacterium JZ-2024 1]
MNPVRNPGLVAPVLPRSRSRGSASSPRLLLRFRGRAPVPGARLAIWRHDPIAFIADGFREHPDAQQAQVLRALPHCSRIAVRSGNGCGKTWLATRSALWFFLMHPGAKVIVTAPTWRQVERVFWAELHAGVHRTQFPKWIEFSRTSAALRVRRSTRLVPSESWFIIGLSSDAPEHFHGFHGPHILFILDEASGVPDEVFDAMEGNRASGNARLLVIGNPTRTTGRFYEIFHHDRGTWTRFHFSGLLSQWVSRDWIAEKKAEWGESSDLYRVRVLGEFPCSRFNALFSRDALSFAINHPIPYPAPASSPDSRSTFRFAGIDVARFGEDFSVLSLLQQTPDGTLFLLRMVRWSHLPLNVLAEVVSDELSHATPHIVCVDDTGVGGGLTDLLHARGFRVRPVLFSAHVPENLLLRSRATAPFANLKSALAWRLRSLMENRLFRVTPEIADEDRARLIHQCLGMTYRLTDTGRLIAEDPPGKSPDELHSLLVALSALNRAPVPRFATL